MLAHVAPSTAAKKRKRALLMLMLQPRACDTCADELSGAAKNPRPKEAPGLPLTMISQVSAVSCDDVMG